MKTREYHGMRRHPVYAVWKTMIQRCTNPRNRRWADYGGRGITVCEQWRASFATFYADMGPRPEGTSLDRIKTEGPYEPGNCRWTDRNTQAQNARLRRVNKTGINGVWWWADRRAYVAKINYQGKVQHLIQTSDFFEACCRRKAAELHFNYCVPA